MFNRVLPRARTPVCKHLWGVADQTISPFANALAPCEFRHSYLADIACASPKEARDVTVIHGLHSLPSRRPVRCVSRGAPRATPTRHSQRRRSPTLRRRKLAAPACLPPLNVDGIRKGAPPATLHGDTPATGQCHGCVHEMALQYRASSRHLHPVTGSEAKASGRSSSPWVQKPKRLPAIQLSTSLCASL